ncbi:MULTISPECIES: hypothetical protein [Pantoea]|jgi:uncharacterized membrane protein|uniref:hypothetical protein n=1 Tax=Pantoea TaxID=53335 RepID=UPI0021185516|nr:MULTISPECIES: hypothetical protein [unclassified Pantoea]
MSEAVYMWMIGGYIALMAIFTKVAYSDPNFYLGFLEKLISKLSVYLSIITGSIWIGLYISYKYAKDKLNLTPEQSKLYLTDYNGFILPLSLLFFAFCFASMYGSFLIIVAENKKRPTPR